MSPLSDESADGRIGQLLDLGLCCPRCKGDLAEVSRADGSTLHCRACESQYPILLGIPDLRVFPDPYIGMEDDRAKGHELAAYRARTWEELAARYYEVTLDTVPPAQARQFISGLRVAESRAEAAMESWAALESGARIPDGPWIDVGCGTAPLLVTRGARVPMKIGVDIAFRWLVVARLRLENAGVSAHLVCACAEALPFRDGSCAVYVSQGTLENVRDQRTALSEARRVLRPEGRVRIVTANRTSVGPDPHLGIPAGGLVPDRLASWIARQRGALPPQRQLLSGRALATMLAEADFDDIAVGAAALAPAQRASLGMVGRALADVFSLGTSTPLLSRALRAVGPSLAATARV